MTDEHDDNEERVERIAGCFRDHYNEFEPNEDNVCDMLTDTMHFCSCTGVDFDSCLSMATTHFSDETGK